MRVLAGGYTIATAFLREGRLRSDFFFWYLGTLNVSIRTQQLSVI
ncbi:hypothetical protein [Nostoc sp.]